MHDVFRPRGAAAMAIYDAFQREADKRGGREFAYWRSAEQNAVYVAARLYADEHGLAVPTFRAVQEAEVYASGHVDYGAKWAYAVACMMDTTKEA